MMCDRFECSSTESARSLGREKYSSELIRYDRHLSAFPPVYISSLLGETNRAWRVYYTSGFHSNCNRWYRPSYGRHMSVHRRGSLVNFGCKTFNKINIKKLQFNDVLTTTCIDWHIENSKNSGGATLWQSSANALPVCSHALPVALPVFKIRKQKLCQNRTVLLPGFV